jgi:hypothetical protein
MKAFVAAMATETATLEEGQLMSVVEDFARHYSSSLGTEPHIVFGPRDIPLVLFVNV